MVVVKLKMAMTWNLMVHALLVGVKRGMVCQYTQRVVTLR